jgi:3-hydroxybutyrate dehydrogenase
MHITLDGRTAMITGGSKGLGLAMAKMFAESGGHVALVARGAEALEAAAAEIRAAAPGAKVVTVPADIRTEQGCADAAAAAIAGLGQVDILVNNAGTSQRGPFLEISEALWKDDLDLKLMAAIRLCRAVLPGMAERKWGRIISTASAHSIIASPYKSAYVAAKHGVNGLMKTVALELATHGVTANCISPGYVWTPLVEKQIPETMKARGMTKEQVIHDVLLEAQPTKQFVTSEQMAALAVFLCSDAAAQLTGANIPVDGGWTAH